MKTKQWLRKNEKWVFLATVILLVVGGFLLLALTPAGGTDKFRLGISAIDFFSEQTLEIWYPNRGEPHGSATSFRAKDSLEELDARIQKQQKDAVETQIFGENHLLIWGKNPKTCYMIFREDANDYLMFDMSAVVVDSAANTRSGDFILPYHFVRLVKQTGVNYQLENGTLYELAAQKQDFLDFYQKLGRYTVTETQAGFLLEKGAHPRSEIANTPLEFHFVMQDGKSYVRLTV